MPNPLNNVLVPDQYNDATCAILNIYGGRGGTFDVRDHPVFYQLQYGSLGAPYFTEETALQPAAGSIEAGAIGIRFRNQTAGQAATVDAKIAPPGQPLLTLTSAGTTAATVLTGSIPALGATPTAGTGFTYTHVNGTGTYVFTFTTAFLAAPLVLATIAQAHTAGRVDTAQVSGVTAAGFTVETAILTTAPADGLADIAFNFAALVVV